MKSSLVDWAFSVTDVNKDAIESVISNEPKIPFVAKHFNVPTINFWDFLSENHFIAK
ncbi:hypothetical protein FD35_GL001224 [Furfurilactobacillus rossiae DSM 15814]|uniref:Uncharacterized protein n=1 Tax=Furfurilactobacillus rossiae DSM 15814 TaxID=1114972 RepID=A0A0R1RIX7_9LACO|nr:hypothetical protein FD35_GL001224 [Furfurilactobacillus rossiae DSM 15814]